MSPDTLDPVAFAAISRRGQLSDVLAGIEAADRAGLKVNINAVAQKGLTEPCAGSLGARRGMGITSSRSCRLGDIEAARFISIYR